MDMTCILYKWFLFSFILYNWIPFDGIEFHSMQMNLITFCTWNFISIMHKWFPTDGIEFDYVQMSLFLIPYFTNGFQLMELDTIFCIIEFHLNSFFSMELQLLNLNSVQMNSILYKRSSFIFILHNWIQLMDLNFVQLNSSWWT